LRENSLPWHVIKTANNAIKYSPGAELIIVSMETQQENIIVSVRDFGIGIARERLNRLLTAVTGQITLLRGLTA
jgi:signal transduction histidine kinase